MIRNVRPKAKQTPKRAPQSPSIHSTCSFQSNFPTYNSVFLLLYYIIMLYAHLCRYISTTRFFEVCTYPVCPQRERISLLLTSHFRSQQLSPKDTSVVPPCLPRVPFFTTIPASRSQRPRQSLRRELLSVNAKLTPKSSASKRRSCPFVALAVQRPLTS